MPTKPRKNKTASSVNADKPAQAPHPKDSDKLGPVEDQPRNSRFGDVDPNKPKRSLPRRRLPGWHADTQKGNGVTLYPEEGLRALKVGNITRFEPFTPFFDEKSSGPNVSWLGKVLEPPSSTSSEFEEYLWKIAKAIRRYNADLYFLRRLHFHENGEPLAYEYPKRNPDDDRDNPDEGRVIDPRKDPTGFAQFVGNGCETFNATVDYLNDLLDKGLGRFKNTVADMVEVNGYIISMRIISPGAAPDELRAAQIGGSSSSYVYISSPFSSSAP